MTLTYENIVLPAGIQEVPYSDAIDYGTFSRVLDMKYMSATYKPFWFRAILDEVSLGNNIITFRKLVSRMVVYAWYPITAYKLNFGVCDSLAGIVNYIADTYKFESNYSSEELLDFIYCSKDRELNKKLNVLTLNVPYRFLYPFYIDKLHKTKKVLQDLEKISVQDENSIYKIKRNDNNEKYIELRNKWFMYFTNNNKILKEWSIHKLVCFLNKKNPNVPAISYKLEPPIKRDLTAQTKIWKSILRENKIIDIYINKQLCNENYKEYGSLSLDHFVPWSFVLHDQMWNLIPTFKNINSRKSDNLLDYDKYIEGVSSMQYISYCYVVNHNKKCQEEEYIDLLRIDDPSRLCRPENREEFYKRIKEVIYPVYNIAKNQGFKVVDIF